MPNIKYIFVFLFGFLINEVAGQVYPVQGTATLIPPYALRLSDYQTSTTDRIVANVLLADVTKAELHARFRISIVGQNVKLETKPEYIGSPISLQGGIPLRLTNIELAEYFDPNHLNFSGISKSDFLKTGFLPEGFYQFCIEVYEYNRGVKISNSICAPAWLILNDPPLINLPLNGSKLKPLSPQNVILQWTPRHTGSPNAAFTTEYDVKVVEVWPATRNPNDAILTQPAIYEATTNSTTLIYGPDATQLEPGRTYAFRVQARAMTGAEHLDLFKNNGYSETATFIYGDACDAPVNVTAQAATPTRFTMQWDASPSQTGYTVQYRVKDLPGANWYTSTTLTTDVDISGLQPNTTYEYQVMSTCGSFESSYGNLATITTEDVSKQGYVCGVAPGDFNLDPSQLLPILKVGDIVNAGDFDVTITKVSGTDGVFSGEGAVVVPFLNQVRGKVAFDNITVNNDKRLVNGFMNVTGGGVEVVPSGVMNLMDQLSQGMDAAEKALDSLAKLFPPKPDPTTFIADTQIINVPAGINRVYRDPLSGSVIIVDNNGKSQTVPAGTNVAVTDNNGKGVLVNSQGGITNTSAAQAIASTKREFNLNVTFAKADNNTHYGLDEKKMDALASRYDKLGDSYYVAWKAVSTSGGDPVVAVSSSKDVKLADIKFEQDGTPLSATVTGNSVHLTAFSVAAETKSSLVARIVPADTSKKEQILGKLSVVGYDSKQFNVHIVPVNGVVSPANKTAIESKLKEVYSQAVVSWTVVMADNIQVSGLSSPFDNGSSGLLSNYTKDMRTVINSYVDSNPLQEGDYYLFVVPQGTNPGEDGFMPRGKQCGFIFLTGNATPESITRAMAHELGHGAFTLKHTFPTLSKGSTNNLMDYDPNNGAVLWKKQWDQIHDPVTVLGLFEGDDAGASVNSSAIIEPSQDWEDFHPEQETKYLLCFTPAGKIFALPLEAKLNFINNTSLEVPTGALVSYELNNKSFFANYEKRNGKWYFKGYFDKTGSRGYSYLTQEQVQAQLDKPGGVSITTASLGVTLVIPLEKALLDQWKTILGSQATQLKNVGRFTLVSVMTAVVLDLFVSTSSLEYGIGEVVLELPLPNLALTNDDNYVSSPPNSIPIAIPHALTRTDGYCHVYVIWGERTDGPFVAKYGMTCQEDYANEGECNPRPDLQCNKFRRENTDPSILDYKYSWVIRNVNRDVAFIVERSMTAGYVIAKGGKLPPNHYLPCFVKKDEFETRIDRATEWLNEQIKKFGR